MITLNFTHIRWFNPKSNKWITDYLTYRGDDYCIISTDDESVKYRFFLARSLATDAYAMLNEVVNFLVRRNNPKHPPVKIINLGLNNESAYVSGQFDILPIREDHA